jgi:cell division protein FtsW (lipid II flippase)
MRGDNEQLVLRCIRWASAIVVAGVAVTVAIKDFGTFVTIVAVLAVVLFVAVSAIAWSALE